MLDESPGLGARERAGRQKWFGHSHPGGRMLAETPGLAIEPASRCQSQPPLPAAAPTLGNQSADQPSAHVGTMHCKDAGKMTEGLAR